MSSNDRPTEKEQAQAYFAELIRDPNARPVPDLNPETARFIRELVAAEQAATGAKEADFASIRQRIRQNIQPPAGREMGKVQPGHTHWTNPVFNENVPSVTRRSGGLAWGKFTALAGMAATIVLVVGLLVLSLAAVKTPDATPAIGASPAPIPTVAVPPSPSPTLQPTATSKTASDLLSPKVFLSQALLDVAKSLSLDYNTMQKQLQSGLTLAEIAKKQGVSLDALKAVLLDSFKAQIDKEKTGGLLTQAQADELFKASSAFIDDYVVSQSGPTIVKFTPTPDKKG